MVGVRVWGVFIFIPVAYILWAFLMKKTISLALFEYEMVIANSALRDLLAIYHLTSNSL